MHPKISADVARKLGVRSLRLQLLQSNAEMLGVLIQKLQPQVTGGGAGAPAGRGMAMGGGTGGPQVNMQMAMMQQQMAMMQQQIAQQQMMMRYGGAAGAGAGGPRAPMPMGYGAPAPSGALPENLNELDDASKAFGFMGNAGGGSADAFDFVKGEITKNKGAI